MSFQINKFIKDEISNDKLKDFLRSKGMPNSLKKEDLFTSIEEEVNKYISVISEEEINNFIAQEIKFGKRRSVFFSHFSNSDSRKLASKRANAIALKKLLDSRDIANFNAFNTLENNEFTKDKKNKYNIEYLNVIESDNSISKVEFCYSIFDEYEIPNNDGSVSKEAYKEYIWVEIDTVNKYVCTRIHPPKQDAFGTNHSAISLFKTVSDKVYNNFGINKTDLSFFDETLYDIFSEITEVSEKPFREKVSEHLHLIQPFVSQVNNTRIFQKEDSQQLFESRIIDLFERITIQDNFSLYFGYTEGKEGVLNKMHFTDGTGASVNASAGSKAGDTLELSDVFFDTRKTIKDEKRLNTLWIDWFKIEGDNIEEPQRIQTKFDTADTYYLIHFNYINLCEEVQDFVFSKLENYNGFRWRKTN